MTTMSAQEFWTKLQKEMIEDMREKDHASSIHALDVAMGCLGISRILLNRSLEKLDPDREEDPDISIAWKDLQEAYIYAIEERSYLVISGVDILDPSLLCALQRELVVHNANRHHKVSLLRDHQPDSLESRTNVADDIVIDDSSEYIFAKLKKRKYISELGFDFPPFLQEAEPSELIYEVDPGDGVVYFTNELPRRVGDMITTEEAIRLLCPTKMEQFFIVEYWKKYHTDWTHSMFNPRGVYVPTHFPTGDAIGDAASSDEFIPWFDETARCFYPSIAYNVIITCLALQKRETMNIFDNRQRCDYELRNEDSHTYAKANEVMDRIRDMEVEYYGNVISGDFILGEEGERSVAHIATVCNGNRRCRRESTVHTNSPYRKFPFAKIIAAILYLPQAACVLQKTMPTKTTTEIPYATPEEARQDGIFYVLLAGVAWSILQYLIESSCFKKFLRSFKRKGTEKIDSAIDRAKTVLIESMLGVEQHAESDDSAIDQGSVDGSEISQERLPVEPVGVEVLVPHEPSWLDHVMMRKRYLDLRYKIYEMWYDSGASPLLFIYPFLAVTLITTFVLSKWCFFLFLLYPLHFECMKKIKEKYEEALDYCNKVVKGPQEKKDNDLSSEYDTQVLTEMRSISPCNKPPPSGPPPTYIQVAQKNSILEAREKFYEEVEEHQKRLGRVDRRAKSHPIESFLLGLSVESSVVSFIVSLLTTVPYSEDRVKCVAGYINAFHKLLVELRQLYPEKFDECMDVFYTQMGYTNEQEAQSDMEGESGWMDKVASNMEQVFQIAYSPMAESVDSWFSFLASLPLLASDIKEATTYQETYKAIMKTLKTTGFKLSSVIRSMVGIHTAVTASTSIGGKSNCFKAFFMGKPTRVEYIEIQRLYRTYVSGGEGSQHINVYELGERAKRLILKYEREQMEKSNSLTDSRLLEANDLLNRINRNIMVSLPKAPAYSLALDGFPGVGKSAMIPDYSDVIHKWIGKKDLESISMIDLDQKFDQRTTSRSTHIVIDDGGALKLAWRSMAVSAMAKRLIQPFYTMIEKAEAHEKGVHFYMHDFVTWLDNDETRQMQEELYCANAGMRRLGDCFSVKLKPEYDDGAGKLKKGEIFSYGEHLLFRHKIWKTTGEDGMSVEKEFVSDWMDYKEWFAYIKPRVLQHFAHENALLERKLKQKHSDLCPQCNILPTDHCRCSIDPDVNSPTQEAEADDGLAVNLDNPILTDEMINETGLSRFALWVVNKVRVRLIENDEVGKWCLLIFETNRAEMILTMALLSYICAVDFTHVANRLGFALLLLFTALLFHLLRKLKKIWHASLWMTDKEVVSQTFSFMSESKEGIFKALKSMAAVVATAYIWESFFKPWFRSTLQRLEHKSWNKVVDSEIKLQEMRNQAEFLALGPKQEAEGAEILSFGENGLTKAVDPEPSTDDAMVKKTTWEKVLKIPPALSEASSTTSPVDLCRMCKEHLYKFEVQRSDGSYSGGQLLLLESNIAIMPAHYALVLDEENKKWDISEMDMVIEDHRSGKQVKLYITSYDMKFLKPYDKMLIHLPAHNLGPVRSLVKFLPKTIMQGKFPVLMADRKVDAEAVRLEAVDASWAYKYCGLYLQNPKIFQLNRRIYPSEKGSCGAVYVLDSRGSAISMMHVSGDREGNSGAVPLLASDFEEAKQHFLKNSCYMEDLQIPDYKNSKTLRGDPQMIGEEIPPRHPINFLPEGSFSPFVIGCSKANFTPRANIELNPHKETAKRLIGLRDDQAVVPRFKWKYAVGKVLRGTSTQPKEGDVHLLMMVYQFLRSIPTSGNNMRKFEEKCSSLPRRALTVQEVLNGIPDSPIKVLKLSASSGEGGKKDAYIYDFDGERYPVPVLLEALNQAWEMLKKGEASGRKMAGSLKVELTKPEKNESGEHRIFYVGSLVDHIQTVQLFGVGMEFILANDESYCQALGLNRVGTEWKSKIEKFFKPQFINNCYDTDYSGYDINQEPRLRAVASHLKLDLLRDLGFSENDINMLRLKLSQYQTPVVDLGGVLTWFRKLWLSGLFTTAEQNGMVSLILRVYDFFRFVSKPEIMSKVRSEKRSFPEYPSLAKGQMQFFEHVALLNLGDDSWCSVSDYMRNELGYDPNHFVDSCSEWGLTVTSGDKTDQIMYKQASQCEFLKSWPSYHTDLKRNVSVVGPKSYLKGFIGWIPSKSITMNEHHSEITENALREAFFGGKQCFEVIRERLCRYFSETDWTRPMILDRTYSQWLEIEKDEEQEPLPGIPFDRGMELLIQYEDKMEAEGTDIDKEDSGGSEEKLVMEQNIAVTEQEVPDTAATPKPMTTPPVIPKTEEPSILQRRLIIHSFNWQKTGLGTRSLAPIHLMLNQPVVKDRMRNIAFFSGDVKVTFEVVAPGSIAGAFLVALTYHPWTLDENAPGDGVILHELMRASQRQHVIVKLGDTDGFTTIIVPFLYYGSAVPTGLDSSQFLPTLQLYSLQNPINSIGSDVTINVKVYGEFMNMNLYGATGLEVPANTFYAEGEDRKISGALKNASSAANFISKIPGLGMAGTAADVLARAGDVAHYFGFSKSLEVPASGSYIPRPAPFMPNGAGGDYGEVLAVQPTQEFTPSGLISGFPEDELAFGIIATKPSIVAIEDLTETQAYDHVLATMNVTPSIFRQVNADPDPLYQPAACAVPGMHFRYWCGTMHYRFQVFTPSGISGRIKVLYDPLVEGHSNSDTTNTKIGIEDTNEHVLFDYGTEDTLDVSVGYSSCYPALEVWPRLQAKDPLNRLPKFPNRAPTEGHIDRANLHTHWREPARGHTGVHNGRIIVKIHDAIKTSGSLTSFSAKLVIWAWADPNMRWFEYTSLPYNFFPEDDTKWAADNNYDNQIVPQASCNAGTSHSNCSSQGGLGGTEMPTQEPTLTNSTMVPNATVAVTTMEPTTLAPTMNDTITSAPTTLAPTPAPTNDFGCRPREVKIFDTNVTKLIVTNGSGASVPGATLLGGLSSPFDWLIAANETEWDDFNGLYYYTKNAFEINEPNARFRGVGHTQDQSPVPADPYIIYDEQGVLKNVFFDGSVIAPTPSTMTAQFGPVYQAINGQVIDYHVWERCDVGTLYLHSSVIAEGIPERYGVWTDNQNRQIDVTVVDQDIYWPGCSGSAFFPVVGTYQDWPSAYPAVQFTFGILYTGDLQVEVLGTGTTQVANLPSGGDKLRNYIFTPVNLQATSDIILRPTPGGTTPIVAQIWMERHLTWNQNRRLSRVSSWLHNLTGTPVDNERETGWALPKPASISNSTRSLRAKKHGLEYKISVYDGEGQEAEGFVRHFGSDKEPQHVGDVLSGENVQSFRELISIPVPSRRWELTGDNAQMRTRTFAMHPYTRESHENSSPPWTTLDYLVGCFSALRGGMVYHFHICGEGILEVSRVHGPENVVNNQISGLAICDSRVNPHLIVKIPIQRNVHFTYVYEMHKLDTLAVGELTGWGSRVMVKIYRACADDFTLMGWNGANRIKVRPGNYPWG